MYKRQIEAYLPSAENPVPVTTSGIHHDYGTEREALLSMIMGLRSEVAALRERVDALSPRPAATLPPVLGEETEPRRGSSALIRYEPPMDTSIPEEKEEARTLEDTERETIKRALERHSGRRKMAARELNISERTLYRKIKEYGLE